VVASAAEWDYPSALEGMSVGALAAHTARSVTLVDHYLAERANGETERLDAPGYYLSVDGLGPDLETEVNQAVQDRAARDATIGPEAVLDGIDRSGRVLRAELPGTGEDRTISVLGGRVMLLDDYLVTRLVEIVVHADDISVSLGRDLPDFSEAALDLATSCLIEIARRRHGRPAMIRALARRERDNVEALRVL
jgi:uncharacterized protein (TIGR03083 family)